jgi:hypothetical protein
MKTHLVQLQKRIEELEELAEEISKLAEALQNDQTVQPQLSIKGQQWYRGARELLVQHNFSGLEEFEDSYFGRIERGRNEAKAFIDIQRYIQLNSIPPNVKDDYCRVFTMFFSRSRALLLALQAELASRELPVTTQLSFAVAADEFDKAGELLRQHSGDEALLRASGVIARVALERHLFCVAETRSLTIIVNPPTKKRPDVEDVLNTLIKASVITPVQKSHFDSLFRIANNCAHPKEPINSNDVERLIRDGRAEAAAIR